MSITLLMPALSPTMEKGTLSKWLKKEGDIIKSGDAVAEIETDKATMEIEAADEGVLAKILVPEGTEGVAVNAAIALLAEQGEDIKEVAAQQPKAAPSIAPNAPKAENEVQPSVSVPQIQVSSTLPVVNKRIFATPLAKILAKEKGMDLDNIIGSGPSGRIIAADVKNATASLKTPVLAEAKASIQKETSGNMSSSKVKALYESDSYTEIKLDGMRKTIASRLTEAKSTVPHFYLTLDIQLDALLALRKQLNDAAPKDQDGKPDYKLSVNDFVIKALAVALRKVPEANAIWAEDCVLKFNRVDIGVAVSVDGGLFTPVLRHTETKSLSAISNEMKELASKARNKKLKPEEYQGGSIAISNLGMFGVKEFSAIINPPQSAILAVGAGEERVIARNGVAVVAQIMSVSLSCDHRVIDGALGAILMKAFKETIENPMTMLV